jgi:transposase
MERSYQEWLPENHPAYVLSEIVDHLDLSPVTGVCDNGGPGTPRHDSRMLVKLVLYAYAVGIFSSREIARQCVENVAFRLLMAGNIPDFQVISEFRQRHLPALRAVFLQVLRCSRDIGLEKLGSLPLKETGAPVRGSKTRAKGSRRKTTDARSLEAQVKELLARAEEVDAAEDLEYGPAQRGDELPAALAGRDGRRQAISTALAALGDEVLGVLLKVVAPASESSPATPPSDGLAGAEPMNGQEDMTDHTTCSVVEPGDASITADPAEPPARSSEQIASEDAGIAVSATTPDAPSLAEAVGANDGLGLEQALAEFQSWIEPAGSVAETDAADQGDVQVEPEKPMAPPGNGQGEPVAKEISPSQFSRVFRERASRVRMPEQSTVLLQLRETKLLDISVSGALVEHTIPIRIGNLYRLSIPVEGHQVQVWARAARAYASHFVSSTDGERHMVYRTGMQFVRFEQDSVERLAIYIDRLLAEGRGMA